MLQLPKAKFEYVHHYIKKFSMNCDIKYFTDEYNFQKNLKYSIDYNIINAYFNNEQQCHNGTVEYTLDVFYSNKKIVHLIMPAIFKGSEDIPADDFIQMLYNNGAPTISNIARSFIISSTAHLSPGMCPILVPMTNWLEFFKNKFSDDLPTNS